MSLSPSPRLTEHREEKLERGWQHPLVQWGGTHEALLLPESLQAIIAEESEVFSSVV